MSLLHVEWPEMRPYKLLLLTMFDALCDVELNYTKKR